MPINIVSATLAALSPATFKDWEQLEAISSEEGFTERKIIWEKTKQLLKINDEQLQELLAETKWDERSLGRLEGRLDELFKENTVIAEEIRAQIIRLSNRESLTNTIDISGSDNVIFQNIKQSNVTFNQKIFKQEKLQSPDHRDTSGFIKNNLWQILSSNFLVFVGLGLAALGIHFLVAWYSEHLCIGNNKADSRLCDVQNENFQIYIFQIVLISVMLVFSILITKRTLDRIDTTILDPEKIWTILEQHPFSQLLKGWIALWSTWLLLYLFMLLGGILKIYYPGLKIFNISLQITTDFLNIANSAVFFYLFLVLDMPSVPYKNERSEQNKRDRRFKIHRNSIYILCIVIFLITAFSRFHQYDNWEPWVGFLVYSSGILVGTAQAFMTGRMDSHYMNVNRLLLAPLYIYAVIQIVGVKVIDFQNEQHKTAFFVTALALKFYLFVIISYWIFDKYFDNYFDKGIISAEKRLKEEAKRHREN